MQIFLIHGMGRSPLSMVRLGRVLKRSGHSTTRFRYSVRNTQLNEIAANFAAFVRTAQEANTQDSNAQNSDTQDCSTQESDARPYAIIGHSLGNIVTRLASADLPPGFKRFVMLAPPNQSPALARVGQKHALFRMCTGDAGARLADPAFYKDLPTPNLPTQIIAGDHQGRARWLPYRGLANDGIVSIAETKLENIEHHTINAVHSFIMDHPGAHKLIFEFLNRDPIPPAGPGRGSVTCQSTYPTDSHWRLRAANLCAAQTRDSPKSLS